MSRQQQRNGNNGRQRGLSHHAPNQREPKPLDIKIMHAKDASLNATTVLRMYGRDAKFLAEFPNTIPCLRGEACRRPIEPEMPPLNGNQNQRDMRRVAYQAEMTAFVKETKVFDQERVTLQARVHYYMLGKGFRTDFEGKHPDHATMDLEDYIQAVKDFYNLSISKLPLQRINIVKKEWWELKQSESESLPEFRQTFQDKRHAHDSVMPPDQLLSPQEISETFIRALNSSFQSLQARMEREQLQKQRIVADGPQEPILYLNYIGYPPTLEEAYEKAQEHEESQLSIKGKNSHLSSFNTVAADQNDNKDERVKHFTNAKTGERKTLKEMTLKDSPLDYNLSACSYCQPKYPGRHFNRFHDDFMESIKKGKSAKTANKSNGRSRKNTDNPRWKGTKVERAYATLQKAVKQKEKQAKKAENKSNQAAQYATLLSSFEE